MSFDHLAREDSYWAGVSQSLSSRAMSFDKEILFLIKLFARLNPFRAGQCLSTQKTVQLSERHRSLNPFRAGQCLSTRGKASTNGGTLVSIPFEQGNVFRRK